MGDSVDRTQQTKGSDKMPKMKRGGGGEPPQINAGSWVQLPGGRRGRVSAILTSGTMDSGGEASKDKPGARIALWGKDGDDYKSTGETVTTMVKPLKRIAPLQKKTDPGVQLMGLLAAHEQQIESKALPETARVSSVTISEVYRRGVESYPGWTKTTLSKGEWAVGRVKAFLTKAAGGTVANYRRDDDLLATPATATSTPAEPATEEKVFVDPADVAALLGSNAT